jgi:hypothetical protein
MVTNNKKDDGSGRVDDRECSRGYRLPLVGHIEVLVGIICTFTGPRCPLTNLPRKRNRQDEVAKVPESWT